MAHSPWLPCRGLASNGPVADRKSRLTNYQGSPLRTQTRSPETREATGRALLMLWSWRAAGGSKRENAVARRDERECAAGDRDVGAAFHVYRAGRAVETE